MQKITNLELETILLFYTFSDQFGTVDIDSARRWSANRLGVFITLEPFSIEQKHVDLLMDAGLIVDTRFLFEMLTLGVKREIQDTLKKET